MSLYKIYKCNEQMEKDHGICLDYGGAKIWVKRAGGSNQRYHEAVRKRLINQYKRQIENDTLPEEVSKKVMAEIYADTIVIKWEGVTDENGNTLEYCRGNVIQLFLDLPELFRDVQDQAGKFSNFKEAELDEERKN